MGGKFNKGNTFASSLIHRDFNIGNLTILRKSLINRIFISIKWKISNKEFFLSIIIISIFFIIFFILHFNIFFYFFFIRWGRRFLLFSSFLTTTLLWNIRLFSWGFLSRFFFFTTIWIWRVTFFFNFTLFSWTLLWCLFRRNLKHIY